MSCTCDPCLSSCPIATPPGGCDFRTTSTIYYTFTSTSTTYTTRYTTYTTYTTATPTYAMSSPLNDHSAIIGTSITLGVVSGIILPICIALIFYYRRYAKLAFQYQNPAAMTTQSEQISMQNFANGANRNTLNNQRNPNSGTSAVYYHYQM
ncbi:hypothetical protein F8M41_026561 [Gigaspora margarita]|uniref:Uncharacterized protein n=1 Tax=Gigaspora margarita TaxID=4874 RepID=A0A8H4AB35_GIGMA|nr:hypothetical protein F8M41_026561 [Gigaspora margarita]